MPIASQVFHFRRIARDVSDAGAYSDRITRFRPHGGGKARPDTPSRATCRPRARFLPGEIHMAKPRARRSNGAEDDTPEKPPLVLSNVPDATLKRHLNACRKLKADVDTATGAYRAGVKAAKADGVPPEDIAWYVKTRKREQEDVNAELRRRARIADVMSMDIALQPRLFPPMPAAAPERAPKATKPSPSPAKASPSRHPAGSRKALIEAKAQGRAAGANGISKEACPYVSGTPECVGWLSAWAEAQTGVPAREPEPEAEEQEAASA
jgi:ribosome modulation factor